MALLHPWGTVTTPTGRRATAPDAQSTVRPQSMVGNVLINVMERVQPLSDARRVSADLLGLPAAHLEERPVSRTSGVITLDESAHDHGLKLPSETNWSISRMAPLWTVRSMRRAGVQWSGLRPRAHGPPLTQRARPRVVREPAGPAEGETPPVRPPR
jgi:hypothetical protein